MCDEIKVGDQVICIDNSASADLAYGVLKLNKTYTITSISNSSLINVDGVIQRVSRGRFKVVEKEVVDHKSTHDFKAGDRVVCIDASGTHCLTKGKEYSVVKVCVGGALKLDLNNSEYNHSRFKLANKYDFEIEVVKPTEKGLMVVGAVVECVDNKGFLIHEGLHVGNRYTISKVDGNSIKLTGLDGYTLAKTRFKLVSTNNPKTEHRESLYSNLEVFRGINSHNQIIVNEGIYYCERDSKWKCPNKESVWVFFIEGAWGMFNARG